MMYLDLMPLISVGPDITKVRSQLKENRDLIFATKLPEKYIQKLVQEVANQSINTTARPEEQDAYRRQRLIRVFTLKRLGLSLLKEAIDDVIDALSKTPYTVSYPSALAIETIFSLENPEGSSMDQYLTRKTSRRASISREKLMEALVSNQGHAGKAEILKLYKAEYPESEDYSMVFAFTLRQTDLFKLGDFLYYHGKKFGDGFGSFLQTLLMDQVELLLPKTIKATEKWLQEKWPGLKREIIEAKKATTPNDKIKIHGRLNGHEVRHFFSFLYKVKDERGIPALSKNDFDNVFRNGIEIPNQMPDCQPFKLQLSTTGVSLTALQYCIYRFYKLHKPDSYFQDNAFKRNIARFFVYNFTNFGALTKENVERRRKLIRDEKPAKMPFKIDGYIPEKYKPEQ